MSGQPTAEQAAAAAVIVRHARSRADLADLLAMCGLPATDPDPDRPAHHPAPVQPTTLAGGHPMDSRPAPPPQPPVLADAGTQPAPVLIAWGEQHPSSRIKSLAKRASTALEALGRERQQAAAIADAEASIVRLRKQLEAAEQRLRTVKGTAANPPSGELAKIRTWANENGYQVAPHGLIARHVLEAYEAAQQTGQGAA